MTADLLTIAQQHITTDTPLPAAGAIWMARLETAGLDIADLETGALDEHELAEREAQRHHSRQTIESYRTALTLFLRWLDREGRATVGALTLDDLLNYVRALRTRTYDLSQQATRRHENGTARQRLAPRTIYGYTRPLLGFLTLLETYNALGFRTSVARAELTRILPRLPEPVAPTPPDLRRVVCFYDRPTEEDDRTERLHLIRLRNAALLHLLFSSGARISEVLGLNVGDVCRDRHILARVNVYSKGRQQGIIFVRRSAERALATYLSARTYPPAALPLFESLDRRTAGTRLSRTSGWRIVHAAASAVAARMEIEGKHDEAALLRTTSPHTFRHFVGYHLLNEGVDLVEVSQILRHRSVEVTRSFYARYRDMQLQEVHDQYSADPLDFPDADEMAPS
ncbi:MAG: tyrosine-type recombinase/integrase [Chloroflexaceae bacterium]|nr:tyrosine-type recombinase/integrase [Chloroflexaceae bacterium]